MGRALSEAEKAVAHELERILRSPGADFAYDQLPDTFDGRVLNADLARELSPDYRTWFSRVQFTHCTYPACSDYVARRLRETLKAGANQGRTVLFVGGGAASGKSYAVAGNLVDAVDLVFDSNLSNPVKAREMIQSALQFGWTPVVVYVHRPYRLAVQSMIVRAIDSGRYIPLGPPSKLAKLHLLAQRTFVALRAEFEPSVTFRAIVNRFTREDPVPAEPIDVSVFEPGGSERYSSIEELHVIQQNILEAFVADEIDPLLASALWEVEE